MLWIDYAKGFETNGAKDDDDDDDATTSHGADDDDGGLFIHRHASVTTRVRKHTVRSFVHASRSFFFGVSLSLWIIHPSRSSIDHRRLGD